MANSGNTPELADCWRKYHATKCFSGFPKYFSRFDDDSWIFKLDSDLKKVFVDPMNLLKFAIFFSDFNFFFGLKKIFWDCPLSAS